MEKQFNGALGKFLAMKRTDVKKTQAEIAKAVPMDRSSLALIELGRRTITVWEFFRICKAIGCSGPWIARRLWEDGEFDNTTGPSEEEPVATRTTEASTVSPTLPA